MLNIILLGLTSLFSDFSSEIVLPLLPIFIQQLGGTGLAIGLVSGFGDAVAAILKVISGYYADRIRNHKSFVLWGYSFSSLAKFFYPLASTWTHVLAVRSIERIGKGFRDAPRDAIVSESLEVSKRGEGFGIQRAMDSFGAILGSLTVLFLIWKFNLALSTIFFIAAFIGVFSIIPIVFVREPESLRAPRDKKRDFQWTGFSSELKRFITISTIFSLGNFSFMFLILKANSAFGHLAAKNALILTLSLYIFFNIFDAAFSRQAGKWSDRVGRRKVIIVSYILLAVTFSGFLWAKSLVFFLLLFSLYGLFKAFIDASQRSFVSDLSPVEKRASALGAFEACTGLALIPGGLLAGWLWNLDPQFTFVYGFIVVLSSLILLSTLIKKSKSV